MENDGAEAAVVGGVSHGETDTPGAKSRKNRLHLAIAQGSDNRIGVLSGGGIQRLIESRRWGGGRAGVGCCGGATAGVHREGKVPHGIGPGRNRCAAIARPVNLDRIGRCCSVFQAHIARYENHLFGLSPNPRNAGKSRKGDHERPYAHNALQGCFHYASLRGLPRARLARFIAKTGSIVAYEYARRGAPLWGSLVSCGRLAIRQTAALARGGGGKQPPRRLPACPTRSEERR